MSISVIIPTYREPEVLDLCLKSCIEGQTNKNEIIVVVDGFYDENKEVLDKYKNDISVLVLEQNVGLARATNLGVYNASNNLILIVNDDNVFPLEWDTRLESQYRPGAVYAPNQIEPIPSIFKQFIIKDLGRDPETFDLEAFRVFEVNNSKMNQSIEGSTLPIFMSKKDYLRVGGWDESYPGGWVVDCEFFMKCNLNGIGSIRLYNVAFYHFVSIGTKSPDRIQQSQQTEMECHEYFKYKWGDYMKRDPQTNKIFVF
jgi:glycosyltransferase involved in cell wall biosynthesis